MHQYSKWAKYFPLAVFCYPYNPRKPVGLLFITPTRKWGRVCGFPLRSHVKLLARLELEAISLSYLPTDLTLYNTRRDLRVGSGGSPCTLWILAVAFVLELWPSKGPPTSSSLGNDLPFPKSTKESQLGNRIGSKVLSFKFSFCVFGKEKIYDSKRGCKMKTVFSNSCLSRRYKSVAFSPPISFIFYFIFWKGRDDPAEFWSMPIAAFSKSQSQQ